MGFVYFECNNCGIKGLASSLVEKSNNRNAVFNFPVTQILASRGLRQLNHRYPLRRRQRRITWGEAGRPYQMWGAEECPSRKPPKPHSLSSGQRWQKMIMIIRHPEHWFPIRTQTARQGIMGPFNLAWKTRVILVGGLLPTSTLPLCIF